MRASRLTALGITAALAVGGAAPTAASAKAEGPGKHTVIPKSTYVYVNAGVGYEHNAAFKSAVTPRVSVAAYLHQATTGTVGATKLTFNAG